MFINTLYKWTLLRFLAVAMLTMTWPGFAAETREAMVHFFDANTGDLREELADVNAAGKKGILFFFEQEGCPSCLYMKQNVLNRVDVQTLYRRHFAIFTIDLFGSVPLKDFQGRSMTEKGFAAEARIRGTPTFAFHDLSGKEVTRVVGAVRDINEFKRLGEFVASGAYKDGPFILGTPGKATRLP